MKHPEKDAVRYARGQKVQDVESLLRHLADCEQCSGLVLFIQESTKTLREGPRKKDRPTIDQILRDAGLDKRQVVDIVKQHFEPGELEAILRSHPRVRECAVVASGDNKGLVSYLVAEPGVRSDDLHLFLKDKLPSYIDMPSFVLMEKFPLSPDGKVDRNALPRPGHKVPVRILVTGAGGFIGHHLVSRLKADGFWVRGVDIKYPEYEETAADDFQILDLRRPENCETATRDVDQVYHLAADTGGIGYITACIADVSRNNILIDTQMLEASRQNSVKRFLFTSSASIYPQHKQRSSGITPLKEEDAYPAGPEPGYGWEKLFAEELCRYFYHDYGFETRIVRLYSVYGPLGTYEGGKERAAAAICRKVALVRDGGEIEVWGDGAQSRSLIYVDDCVEGLIGIMASNYREPLNLGMNESVTINRLVDLVCEIAGKRLKKMHNLMGPQGVRGRDSDNTRLRQVLGWEPSTALRQGLEVMYRWVAEQLDKPSQLPKEKKELPTSIHR